MSDFRFSVVMPAYNATAHIEAAIGSALKQTWRDLEVVVAENGSTDGTHEVVEAIDDPRVVLVRMEEKGLAAARNRAISEARHDWIAFLDADDEWLPHHLENARSVLGRHTDVRWYCAAFDRLRGDGSLIDEVVDRSTDAVNGRIPEYFIPASRRSFMLPSLTVVHKEVFERVGGFSERISQHGEDLDMWFRAALKYPAYGYSTTIGGHYYRHESSVTGGDARPDPERVFGRIKISTEALSPDDAHRIPVARLVVARWLERWIRLCAKADRRELLARIRELDPRLVTPRIRAISLGVQHAPEWVMAILRKRSAYGDLHT